MDGGDVLNDDVTEINGQCLLCLFELLYVI